MILENFVLKEKLDTIEDHHNKHTIENQCCPWAARLKNCLGAVYLFFIGFNKASYILETRHFENPKRMEVRT